MSDELPVNQNQTNQPLNQQLTPSIPKVVPQPKQILSLKHIFLGFLGIFTIALIMIIAFGWWRKISIPFDQKQIPEIMVGEGTPAFTEDFEGDLSAWQVLVSGNVGTATLSTDQKHSGSKSLKITNNGQTGAVLVTHTFPQPQQGVVSLWFYDTGSANAGFVILIKDPTETQSIMIGVKTNSKANTYYYRTSNSATNGLETRVPRTAGWHKFEIVVTPKGSYGKIDGINQSYLRSVGVEAAININLTSFSKIWLMTNWIGPAVSYFDELTLTSLLVLPANDADIEYHFVKKYLEQYGDKDYNIQSLGIRLRCNSAFAFAIKYRKEHKSADLSKLVQILQAIINLDYQNGNNTLPWGKGNNSYWGAGIVDYCLSLTSWLVWSELPQTMQDTLKTILVNEANDWASRNPDSGCIHDTKAEENSWTAQFLAAISQMFPLESNSSAWDAKAKSYAYHSFTVPGDPAFGGLSTQTLFWTPYDRYFLENHKIYPYPHYMLDVVGQLGAGAVVYKKLNKPIPESFFHHVKDVFEAHRSKIKIGTSWLWQGLRDRRFSWDGSHLNIARDRPIDEYGFYGDKDEYGLDARCANYAWVYLSQLDAGSYQPLYRDLLEFEFYTQDDYVGFPPLAKIIKIDVENQRVLSLLTSDEVFLHNAIQGYRHALAYLWLDNSISFQSTSPSSTSSPSPSPTKSPTPSPLPPTFTPTAVPTRTPTSTPTKTLTPSPTKSPTPLPSNIPTVTPSRTPTSILYPTSTPVYATATPIRPTVTPVIRPSTTSIPVSPTSARQTLTYCTTKSQGDANCDGMVNGVDYSLWLNSQCRKTTTQSCANLNADFNTDGNVDDSDYLVWFGNRG